jgi:hypothetical protein
MGRPIKDIYINAASANAGGEGVLSFAVTTQGNNYSQGTTISFAASPLGGTTATGTITVWTPQTSTNLSINRTTQTLTNAGSGYIVAPAITVVKPANVTVTATAFSGNLAGNILTVSDTTGLYVGMHQNHPNIAQTAHILTIWSGNGNVELSRGVTSTFVAGQSFQFGDVGRNAVLTATLVPAVTTGNTIQANAWTSTGTIASAADIIKQKSTKKYRVTNVDGVDNCILVANAAIAAANGPIGAGQMTIVATDSDSGTYLIKKLFDRTVVVYPAAINGASAGTQFEEDDKVSWNMNAAVASTSVKLATND